MRKTRLVILPGARCLHQLGFLLLFLACPTIAFKGQENRDVQPYCRLLILKQNWIPSNTGKGIGCDEENTANLDHGFLNSDNGNGNVCHNNNTKFDIKNCLNASIDKHFKIFEKKSNSLDVSRFQKDGLKIHSRRLQREVRLGLTEVKRIQLDNKRRIYLDTRRDTLSRSLSRSRQEKRDENGRIQIFTRMQLVQERRERRNSEEIKRKDSSRLRSTAFVQNRMREVDSATSRRITERRDSLFQTGSKEFNTERIAMKRNSQYERSNNRNDISTTNRKQNLAKKNERIINSVTISSVMDRRDSQDRRTKDNRSSVRCMRENSESTPQQRNIFKREARRISRDVLDRRSEDRRIMARRESRILSRENTRDRRSLIEDNVMIRSLGERNSENRNSRITERNSDKRRSAERISLSRENGRITVRDTSLSRSNNRNHEDRKTFDRQISSYGLIRRKTEHRTLTREKRSVDSMERNPLRELSQRRIISVQMTSVERSFDRESKPNYRDNSRTEQRDLEARRTSLRQSRFRRNMDKNENLVRSSRRNSEGRMILDRELSLTFPSRRNSVDRRIEERDNSLSRSLQRNYMERRFDNHELSLLNSARRNIEHRRSMRGSASATRSFRRIDEDRRIFDNEMPSTYYSRRNSEFTRTLRQRDSSSRLLQRDSERRSILDRESLSLYSTRRYSENERLAARDDSSFPNMRRIHLNRRSLPKEILSLDPVRMNLQERNSVSRTNNLVRSFERKMDERRINARESVSRESFQRYAEIKRNSNDRKVLAREITLIRLERSRITQEGSFRINNRKSEDAGENVLVQTRFGNERRAASETFLRENRLSTASRRSERNDNMGRGTLVRNTMQRFEDRRISVVFQPFRRVDERSIQRRTLKSGERNIYAGNSYLRNVDLNKRVLEARANDNDRRISNGMLTFRIRSVNEPSSLRRVIRDERSIRSTLRNDRFFRQSLPAEFTNEKRFTRNSNINEDLIRNVEKRSLISYRSDLRMTRRSFKPMEEIRFERKSTRTTRRFADLSDNTRFLVRSLESRVTTERKDFSFIATRKNQNSNMRQIRQDTENSSGRFVYRHNNNKLQKIVNFSETRNVATNSKQIEENSVQQSWFNQLFESIKQAGKTLYDGNGKLNVLELINILSMKGNEEILQHLQENFDEPWNNKKHVESYLPGAITGGMICATLYLNVQKREVY